MNDRPASALQRLVAVYLRCRSAADPILKVLMVLRVQILIAALVSLALLNEQAIEALVVMAEDAADPEARRFRVLTLSAVAVSLLVILLWYFARVLLYAFMPDVIDEQGVHGWFVRNAPRFIAVVPLLALSAALFKASASELPTVPFSARILQALAIGCLVLAAVAYVAWRIRRYQLKRRQLRGRPRNRAVTRRIAWTLFALAAMLFVLLAGNPQFASRIGSLTVLLLASALWVPFGTLLVYWGSKARLPLLLILIGFGLLWSALDLNDNHQVRHHAGPSVDVPPLATTFSQWLAGRPDRAQYEGRPYPVFIVATEGGGIYAAAFTAAVLGSLQDSNPAFASHIFAISGVSGGSVGASVFAGLCSEFGRTGRLPGHTFQQTARRVLDRDFLAPLLAAGLFPDLVQRLIPVPIGPFDRARALEYGLERAWRRSRMGDQWRSDFEDLWPDFPRGSVPALLLNTTEVETGQRVVVTNLSLNDARLNKVVSFRDKYPRTKLNLSTAAVLGSRFPLVTPAGFLWSSATRGDREEFVKRRYVDGGYFENSGTSTAAELLHALRLDLPPDAEPAWSVTVIRIGFATDTVSPDQARPTTVPDQPVTPARTRYLTQGLGESLSPLRTMLNARAARGASAVEQLRTLVATLREHGRPAEMVEFTLREEEVSIPLGWLLSNQAFASIASQATEADRNRRSAAQIAGRLAPP